MYKCGQCQANVESISPEVRCPNCAYKVLYKMREPVTKTVLAR